MKKTYYILMAVFALLATGCRQQLAEYDKGNTPLEIKASKSQIVLDQKEYNSDGLTLTWTTGTNKGTGHRIYYSLDIDLAGRGFENAYRVFNGETERYEQVWRVEELNDLVCNQFGVAYGQEAAFTARVTASGDGFEEQVAECDFTVRTYEPVSKTLYLIGNATPGGWTRADATEMEMREVGYFKTTVKMKVGSFKFIVSRDGMLPGYMPGEQEGEMVLRDNAAQPDNMWKIEEEHLYEITANLITMKMTLKQVSAVKPEFDDLYLIGNETDWNFWLMQRDPLDPFLFRIGHYWTKGADFKFGTAAGAWENNYKATSADAPYTQESMSFVKGYDPDNKWVLTSGEINKMYKICVDIHTAQERMIMREFEPYTEMYLVGDATPGGWNLDDAVAMTQEDNSLFTWTGNLSVGALKFSCDRQSDWNGAWFMAMQEDAVPTGETEPTLFIDKHEDSITRYQYAQSADVNVGEIDRKWKIEQAGTYTIVLDQLHETVSIRKN